MLWVRGKERVRQTGLRYDEEEQGVKGREK